MNIIALSDQIRNEDGLFSVYDVIKLCGQKNPRDAWNRLTASYPETVGKCDSRQLINKAGQKGKATPVANRENMLYILGLLPGAIGKKYREDAAKLVNEFLTDPEKLAGRAIDRLEEKGDTQALGNIALRAKTKQERRELTDTIDSHVDNKEHLGGILAVSTNNVYKPLIGGTAKEIREERGLAKKDLTRDSFTSDELTQVMAVEQILKNKVEDENIRNWKIPKRAEDIASKFAEFVKNV